MGLKVITNEKINGIPGEYGKDFMKIKFEAGHNLPLNKIPKLYNTTIVFRYGFWEDNRYYPQVFLVECLYELRMLGFDRIDISERIDSNKNKCIRRVWYLSLFVLLDKSSKYEP